MRYVRTPEGAKKYGQPIGSPIVPKPALVRLRNPMRMTDVEGRDFGDKHWPTEDLDLGGDEREAVERYTGPEYVQINGYLRTGEVEIPDYLLDQPHYDPDTDEELDYEQIVEKLQPDVESEMDSLVYTIQSAIESAPPVPEDIVVSRWVGADAFPEDFLEAVRAGGEVEGATFQEPGFTSTSIDSEHMNFNTVAEFLVLIEVPAGTPALYVSQSEDPLGITSNELLFNTDTAWTVNGIAPMEGYPGRFVIEAVMTSEQTSA